MAIQTLIKLKYSKSAGIDGIHLHIWKETAILQSLSHGFNKTMQEGQVP